MSGRLGRAWRGWVALWDHREHPLSMAIVRVTLGAVLLWDLLWVGALRLVVPILAPEEIGGWPEIYPRDELPFTWAVFPMEPWVAWGLWGLSVACVVAFTLGIGTPFALFAFVLVYAQWAHILDAADRGIDTMMRNVAMILAFSQSHHAMSIDAWRRTGSWWGDGTARPAWARHLLVLQLVVMYFGAGVAKVGSTWTPMGEFSALWYILHDPAVARIDWSFLAPAYVLTQIGTAVTMGWEYTAPLVLLMYWYRHTWDRAGRLRAFVVRWKLHLAWLSIGLAFHLLIAATLNLGIFPFAMLSFYPSFVHPNEWPAALRRIAGVPPPTRTRATLPA